MPTLYENSIVRVRNGWLTGWRIDNKLRGTTIIPNKQWKETIGMVWHEVSKLRADDPDRLGERLMFESFAAIALQPNAPHADILWNTPPQQIAKELVTEANRNFRRS